MIPPDTIFYGGDIITMDEELPKAAAVAILDKVILSVGSVEDVFALATENTKFIFLNKQTLMPGFIDPHQHAITSAEMRATFVNIGALEWDKRPTYQDVHDKMINTIDGLQDCDWGLFFAWDPELIPTLPKLSATFLDENISSKYPIFVVGQNGHVAWINTLALLKAGITDTTSSLMAEQL
ncbi:amidohydrolase family protein [Salmonella sp. s55004]|uniref:amidohydrolase family protein n=1 Tax=Salmonella sp. s55004 TaxID=3159675 RepID=UPI0039801582